MSYATWERRWPGLRLAVAKVTVRCTYCRWHRKTTTTHMVAAHRAHMELKHKEMLP